MKNLIRKLFRPTIGAIYDQLLQSGCNFIALLVLASLLPIEDFAAFALAFALWQVLQGLQRSLVVLPFIVGQPSGQGKEHPCQWAYLNLVFVMAMLASLLLALALVESVGILPWLQKPLELSLFAVPGLGVYEFARRLMYQLGRYVDASIMSTILAIFYLGGIASSHVFAPSSLYVALGIAAGALLAASYGHWRVRHDLRTPSLSAFRVWRSRVDQIAWHLLSYIAHASYTSALPLVVGFFARPEVVAAFSVTRALVTPALTASTAIDSIDKPRASRAYATNGYAGLKASIAQTRRTLWILTVPFVLFISIFSQDILHLLYGDKFAGTSLTVIGWALFIVLTVTNQPEETRLIITQRSQTLFVSKLLSSIVALGLAPALIPPYGTLGAVTAAVSAIGINLALNLAKR
ncbi:hypothetical protein V5F63_19030 [Xanthobacter autotrophicus DSM 597]|uniref:hypothetical protein n=1 Tax=Xanthobacter wiegelii TaxID=3119913 RepID=UPI0037293A68